MVTKKTKTEQAFSVIEPFIEEWEERSSDEHAAFRDWAVGQILWDDMLSTTDITDITACDAKDDKGIDGWFVRSERSIHTVIIFQSKDTQPKPEDLNKLVDGFTSLFGTASALERSSANTEILTQVDNLDQLLDDPNSSIEVECWLLTSRIAQGNLRNRASALGSSQGSVVLNEITCSVRYYVKDVQDMADDIRVLHNVPIDRELELADDDFFQFTTRNSILTISAQIPAITIARWFDKERTNLFRLNPRYYQGSTTKYNKEILETLVDSTNSQNFYVYNNGVTIIASGAAVSPHPTKAGRSIIRLKDLQIVNGCQTTATLHHAWKRNQIDISKIEVPVRIIESHSVIAPAIARATNSQNPMKPVDFRSNDPIHVRLHAEFRKLNPAWFYEHKRGVWNAEYKRSADKKPFTDGAIFGIRRIQMMDLGQAAYAFLGHPRKAVEKAAEIFDSNATYASVFLPRITAPQLLLPYIVFIQANRMATTKKNEGVEFATYLRYPMCYLVSSGLAILAGKKGLAYFSRPSSVQLIDSAEKWSEELFRLAFDELEKEMRTQLLKGSGARSVVRTNWLPAVVKSFEARLLQRVSDQDAVAKTMGAPIGAQGIRAAFPLKIRVGHSG